MVLRTTASLVFAAGALACAASTPQDEWLVNGAAAPSARERRHDFSELRGQLDVAMRAHPPKPDGPWPLGALEPWRRAIPTMETARGWSTTQQRVARVALEVEWERTEAYFGPGPAYLRGRLERAFGVFDTRFRPRIRERPEWPVTPVVLSSDYGWRKDPVHGRRRFHQGLDLAGRRGDVVGASASGVIVEAGWADGYGRAVVIEHPGGFRTVYAHLQRIMVDVGQDIDQGSPVGLMGSTGRSTGPHLHFEVRRDGGTIDPRGFLSDVRFEHSGEPFLGGPETPSISGDAADAQPRLSTP